MLSSGRSSFHPLTRNPWNLAWNPGGSSAGAGAAAAAGYGPLHLGTDIGGSVRLPACWSGIFTLKPSLGRVPIDPPYFGRVVGPMTRTVADSALLMAELSKPDARDHMSLPPAAIDWSAGPLEPKGLQDRPASRRRLGPAGRCRGEGRRRGRRQEVRRRRRQGRAGGAVPVARHAASAGPVLARAQLGRLLGAEPRQAGERAALHRRLVPRRRRRLGRHGDQGRQQLHGDPRRRDARHAALRLRAVAGLAGADLSRRMGDADQRRPAAARAHLLHHALQHERAAGRLDQLRLHQGRQADRPADRRPPLRRSGRDADLALVRAGEGAAEGVAASSH